MQMLETLSFMAAIMVETLHRINFYIYLPKFVLTLSNSSMHSL